MTNENYEYLKNDINTFSILKTYGNQEQAIARAKRLKQNYNNQQHATHNPCTCVHLLIEELLNPIEVLRKIEEESEIG